MLNIADWPTGTIPDWKDEAVSEQLEIPLRTLREQRRKIENLGYIACKQGRYGQEIAIVNWTNPREYTGKLYNEGGSPPLQGDTEGGSSTSAGWPSDGTPTSNSNKKTQRVKQGDLVDLAISQLPTESIRNAIREFWPFNVNWETKYAREWMEWARGEGITYAQLEAASKRWLSDKQFSWQHPNLKLIYEKWPALMAPPKSPLDVTRAWLAKGDE